MTPFLDCDKKMLSGHGSDQTGWCLRGQGELAAGITLGLQARAHSDFPYVFLTDRWVKQDVYTLSMTTLIVISYDCLFPTLPQHFQTFKKITSHFLPWNSQDVFRTLQQGRYRDVLGRAWVETSAKIHIEDVGICTENSWGLTAHPWKMVGKEDSFPIWALYFFKYVF